MKLTSVHHIAVINSNYEKSYDFYVNRLGLKVIFDIERPAKNDRVLMLELDKGLMLEVFIMENPPKHQDAPRPPVCAIWPSAWSPSPRPSSG